MVGVRCVLASGADWCLGSDVATDSGLTGTATTDRDCVPVAEPAEVTARTPTVTATGNSLEITSGGPGGSVVVRGPLNADGLAIGGAHVGRWLAALQRENQALRATVLRKDQAMQQQIGEMQAEYRRQLAELRGMVESLH